MASNDNMNATITISNSLLNVILCNSTSDVETSEDFEMLLFHNAQITNNESLFLLMALVYTITKNATDNLFKLKAVHVPENVEYLSLVYQFSKHFLNWKTKITTYMYCRRCGCYIETVCN